MSNKESKTKPSVSEEERQFFLDEVSDVRPLKKERHIEAAKKNITYHSISNHKQVDLAQQVNVETMSDPIDLRDVEIDDFLFFTRSGIQHKVLKKLRRGEFTIEDELDLHGYTVNEAKVTIQEFFSHCREQKKRIVRIIHGKGFRSKHSIPILKTHIAYWLPQHKDVMAFSSARPSDGGTGAIYVILKVVY